MSDALPSGWQFMPLKFATDDFQNGVWGSDPNGGPDDVICARVADFDRLKLQITDVPTVRRIAKKDRDRCSVQPGDILVEKSGGTDRNPVGTAVSYQGDLPAVYANFIFRIRMSSQHDQRFWLYALHASYLDGRTWNFVRQTTGIQNLDTNGFMSMKHPVPPLETQRRIADYLDHETGEIDAMIYKLGELADELRVRRQSAIDEVFSENHSFAPLWTLTNGVIDCPHTTPVADESGQYEAVRTASIRDGKYLPGKGIRVSEATARERNGDQPPEVGDVFFTREAPAGEACVVPDGNFCLGQRMVMIKPDHTKLDSRFLLYSIYTSHNQQEMALSAGGTTVVNLKLGTIRAMNVPARDLDEQRCIADHLDDVTSKIDAMLAKVAQLKDLLTERRAALITDVVTGRKDVA